MVLLDTETPGTSREIYSEDGVVFDKWPMNEISSTDTALPHGYFLCASQVLHILRNTAGVLQIWVLHILHTFIQCSRFIRAHYSVLV